MNSQNKDLRNILQYYVNCKSKSEIDFIEEQKKIGIKVCDKISHQRSRDGKDELIVETQLSSTNDSSESSGNRASTLLKADSSASRSSLSNSDHFIKEQRVTHVGKSKSLDEPQINRTKNHDNSVHETSVVTVVGNRRGQFETVHKAVVEHSHTGSHTVVTESFVRDASIALPSSYHSLPDRIHNSVSLPTGNSVTRKKSNKGKLWKSLFSAPKKNASKKGAVDMSDIDMLARQRAKETSADVKVHSATMPRTMESPRLLSMDCELPFKSHKIGDPLEPVHKKTKLISVLRNLLGSKSPVGRGRWHSARGGGHGDHAGHCVGETDLGGANVTRVVATLSRDNECEDFTYLTNLDNDEDLKPERRRYASGTDRTSNFQFEMSLSDTRTRRQSCPDKPCNCGSKRMDLIVGALKHLITNNVPHSVIEEISDFDQETFHFKGCPFDVPGIRKDSVDSTHQSRLSLYQSCEHCKNADDHLHPDISSHLLPIIHTLEDGDEINFNEEHLRYFLSANCYKQFEEGMKQAIGIECSAQNLAYLHYITRRVVRHIGDPTIEDNEKIVQIMQFAEKYLVDHYGDHITKHGSVGKFLEDCTHCDID